MNLSEQFMNWSPKKRLWATVLGVGAAVLLLVIAAVLLVCLGGDGRQTMKTESEESWYIPSMGSLPPLPAVGQASSDAAKNSDGSSNHPAAPHASTSSAGGAARAASSGGQAGKGSTGKLNLAGFQKVTGSRNGNLKLGGYVCEKDGWVYYAHVRQVLADKGEEEYSLNKMRPDGTQITVLYNHVLPCRIGVEGGFVYFYDTISEKSIRVRTDGTGKQTILEGVGEFRFVSDGWIYYSNTSFVNEYCRMRPDGTSVQRLSEDLRGFFVANDKIYYVDPIDHYPYQANLDMTEKVKLSNQKMTRMDIQDDWMIYEAINDKLAQPYTGMWRLKIGEDKPYQIYNISAFIGFSQGHFYYDYGDQTYRVKLDGSDRKPIPFFPLGVVGDSLIGMENAGPNDDTRGMILTDQNGVKKAGI